MRVRGIQWVVCLMAIVVIGWHPVLFAQDDGDRASITEDGPQAWFTFSPVAPKPGELITFNAAPSSGDVGLISFQWETTGDGGHDRVGSMMRRSFADAGEYPVTLTVHDALGRIGRVTRVIQVGEQGVNLSIETKPSELTVYIDGERRGQTPIELRVEPGERSLRLRHYWRGTWEVMLDLRHVQSLTLELSLWE